MCFGGSHSLCVTQSEVFVILLKKHRSNSLTASRGHHLIKQLHAGPLPDFLDDSSQLLVGLLKISCTVPNKCHLSATFEKRPHVLKPHEFVPSVLILRAVRTSAKRVALNMTVPSLLRGMFMATSL